MDADQIADRFRSLFAADAAAGRVRTLSSYQRMFKGFETVVEREFAALSAPDAPVPAPAPADAVAAGDAVAAAPPSALPTSELLARLAGGGRPTYAGLGEIARGGMGAVLRVRDDVLARDLAMKVILEGAGTPASDPMTERFVTEARVTAHLDHPGVVPIHELGIDEGGRIYFTMKLVGGRTLAEILELVRRGDAHWTTQRAIALLIRVCDTLAFAHSRGVIHRDVKPANVMVGDFGEVYVMDWGLAKVLGEPGPRGATEEAPVIVAGPATSVPRTPVPTRSPPPVGATQNLTQAGSILGTAGYISPEQARGRLDALDARTDVFAVGAILYELLAGAAPYADASGRVEPRSAILGVIAGPPAPIRRSGVSEELVAIAEKAMAREPADRYTDAAALSRDLQDYVDGRVVRAHRTGPFVELLKWMRRNRALAAAIGAAFVLLVAGLATNLSSLAESRRETARAKEQVFRTSIAAASAALRDHDALAARSRLADVGDATSRWECRVLAARIDESIGTLPGPIARFDREGRLLVVREDGVLVRMTSADSQQEVLLDATPKRVLQMSPDGRWAVVGTCPTEVWAADRSVVAVADGRDALRLPDAPPGWGFVGFHPVRPWLYAFDPAPLLRVFDLETGREIAQREFSGNLSVQGVSITRGADASDDGVLSVLTGRDGEIVELVDARTLAPIGELRGHSEGALASLSLGAAWACTTSLDDTVRGWDLADRTSPRCVWTFGGMVDPVGNAISPDGATLAVAPIDGTLRLFDARTAAPKVVLHGAPRAVPYFVTTATVEFSPDGGRVVTTQREGAVLWDATALDDARVLRGHASFVYDVEFSPDGARLASAGWDGFVGAPGGVRVWDVASGDLVAAVGESSRIYETVAWSADGSRVYGAARSVANEQPCVTCLDSATARPVAAPSGLAWNLHFSPSGDRAAVCDIVGEYKPVWVTNSLRLSVVDMATGGVVATGVETRASDMQVRFVGADLLALSVGEGTIRVLDARTLALRFELRGHSGMPWSAVLSPDGTRIVTAAQDGTARVWDAKIGAPVAVLPGHGAGALCAEYSRDGRLIAVGGRDGLVHLWDAATHEEIVTFSGHTNYVRDVAFSPDGETLASASGDGTIRIWSPEPLAARLAARRERRRLADELRPRVVALLDVPGEFESVASAAADALRADASLTPRAREVALQCLFAECLRRRTESAAPDGK